MEEQRGMGPYDAFCLAVLAVLVYPYYTVIWQLSYLLGTDKLLQWSLSFIGVDYCGPFMGVGCTEFCFQLCNYGYYFWRNNE